MQSKFNDVKTYINDLGFDIVYENKEEEVLLISDEEKGICNLILDCEDPILVIEQLIFDLKKDNQDIYKRLLQMNRNLIHGAFVLDDQGKSILFRDTLQLENLDKNELEASIQALIFALSEYGNEFIEFSKSSNEEVGDESISKNI